LKIENTIESKYKIDKVDTTLLLFFLNMAFTNNRSASRFLNQGIKSKKFLDEMNKVVPWERIVEKTDAKVLKTKPEL